MRLRRCVPCAALLLALACAVFTASAYAGPGPLSSVSADGLLALFGTVLFSLLAGYELRQDRDLRDHKTETGRRFEGMTHELTQLRTEFNLMYADFHDKHPSRPELDTLRQDMRHGFDEVKALIRERR